MASAKKAIRTTEEHLLIGLPVLFSELLVFKWTPSDGFPQISDNFKSSFERMQEVENLDNELRVFFDSFDGALTALDSYEVRKNTFKFIDQYGTIADILKTGLLRQSMSPRNMVPEYLEERIRNQSKWFRGNDDFSLGFAKEFLRRKFSSMRSSFRAPQPTSLLPPVPPPRRNRSAGNAQPEQPQPSTSQAVSSYTASGRLRRNSAPSTTNRSPLKTRTMTAEELPSPPPTPPALREQTQQQQGQTQSGQEERLMTATESVTEEFVQEEEEVAHMVPSTPPSNVNVVNGDDERDERRPPDIETIEQNNNGKTSSSSSSPPMSAKITEIGRPLQETAM